MEQNATSAVPAQTNNEDSKKPMLFLKQINPKLAGVVVLILVLGVLAFYNKQLFVAATVDGHIINRLEVIKRLEKQGGSGVLDALIENQLINNAAEKNNITASEDEINQKIDKIKLQIESQGSTFDEALTAAGLTLDDLKKQMVLQVELEKLIGDKVQITDDEVNKYMTDNNISAPAGTEDETKNQVREQLKTQKFNTEAGKYLSELRTSANIKTYVDY